MGKEKQVIMTYTEHQQWLTERGDYKKQLTKIGDQLAEQEKIMDKLIEERDDIVVIREARMMVQKDWKLKVSYSGYRSYEDRYVNFPRFVSGDELAQALDQGFVEMHGEIRDLQGKLNDCKAGRKKDKIDFNKMNKAIPINVWNALGKRKQERIRKLLQRVESRL